MKLPEVFIQEARQTMGNELFERYIASFEEDIPVSIRMNPKKCHANGMKWKVDDEKGVIAVPWCQNGYYLSSRPNFTFDPLFHAGLYYVQEASSMFLDHVIRQLFRMSDKQDTKGEVRTVTDVLDLCAAPGGKSTLLRSALPDSCLLVSNEPIRNRAQILAENIQKWGYANHVVTNNYPKDYRKAGLLFDMILCDVPCSGEGMFRKDEATIGEWSLQNVEKCWQLQREIVADAWCCLRDGGFLIYSTCTFNTKENEENVRWMMEELGAEVIPVPIEKEWNITGSLLAGFNEPVYRFIPGTTRGEGLFMCVVRKAVDKRGEDCGSVNGKQWNHDSHAQASLLLSSKKAKQVLNVLSDGQYPVPTMKGRIAIPAHAEAIYTDLDRTKYPTEELTYAQAISYLRHEAIVLEPDVPHGFVLVTFMGVPLGFVKNIGNRANNHYPDQWKIKTTHIPQEYETIFRYT